MFWVLLCAGEMTIPHAVFPLPERGFLPVSEFPPKVGGLDFCSHRYMALMYINQMVSFS